MVSQKASAATRQAGAWEQAIRARQPAEASEVEGDWEAAAWEQAIRAEASEVEGDWEAGAWEQAIRAEASEAEGDWQQMTADWADNYGHKEEIDDDEHKSPPPSPKVLLDMS